MKRDFEDPLTSTEPTSGSIDVQTSDNKKSSSITKTQLPKKGLLLTAVFLLAGLVYWGSNQLFFAYYESTHNAYIAGDINRVSSYLDGVLLDVYVDNSDYVEQGQALALLDPTDSIIKLEQARIGLAHAVQNVIYEKQMLKSLKTSVATSKVTLENAKRTLERVSQLSNTNNISENELDQSRHQYEAAKLTHQKNQELLTAKANQLQHSVANHPTVQQHKALYIQAFIENQRRVIKAPVAGYVSQSRLHKGQHLSAGQALLAIVPLNDLWVDANFKENQLQNIRIGQTATIYPDIFAGETELKGVVVGINPTTGSLQSLLPPENATGNWVKVVQRLPVRIRILPEQDGFNRLKLGLSTSVKVHRYEPTNLPTKQNKTNSIGFAERQDSTAINKATAAANQVIEDNLKLYSAEQPVG